MAEDPLQQQLAQAAATITDLRQKLAAAQDETRVASQVRDAAVTERDRALAAHAETQSMLDAEHQQHARDLAAAAASLAAANTATAEARSNYSTLSAKWAAQSDPALLAQGIDRPFRTPDGKLHASAAAALARLPIARLISAGMPEPSAVALARDPKALRAALDAAGL